MSNIAKEMQTETVLENEKASKNIVVSQEVSEYCQTMYYNSVSSSTQNVCVRLACMQSRYIYY